MSRISVGAQGLPESTDLLVVGLGATGAGVALDAASRGLEVAAVDAFDIAWGTSRWSSKLVHGGLRYLANLQLGVARESAVERGILMQTTAPHLVHALPMLLPLTPTTTRRQGLLAGAGLCAGDVLRMSARTSRRVLPGPRRLGVSETLALAPVVRRAGLRGALLGWDGQLEDDARLVVTITRTAVQYGARVHTRTRVLEATGTGAMLRDELTGETREIQARSVVNATGVWAGELVPEVQLQPSRGTHLVLRGTSLPGLRAAVMASVPGEANRYVFALPQPDDTCYVGLTDEPVGGPIPEVPAAPESDVDFLLAAIGQVLERPLTRADVVGTYAGLRPLLEGDAITADLSRRHAVLVSRTGLVTVVGGKLTTYRRMAQDAVDLAVARSGLVAASCGTHRLPLLGAARRERLAALSSRPGGSARLVRRFGAEAPLVVASAAELTRLSVEELLSPLDPTVPVTLAELVFGVTHEGAGSVDDLLDRRTRVGLVAGDRELARPHAERALELVQAAAR